MQKTAVRQFTSGSIFRCMIGFFLPLLGGYIITAAGNAVNTFILGKVIGSDALAASSAVSTPISIVTALLAGVVMGVQVTLSRSFGTNDGEQSGVCIASGLLTTFCISVLVSGITLAVLRPVLQAMHTPEDILDLSVLYGGVTLAYMTLTYMYQALLTIYNAAGNGQAVMLFNFLDVAFRIVFDVLFVVVLRMGIYGILIASVVTTLCSFLVCLLHMRRHTTYLHFRSDNGIVRPRWDMIRRIIAIGIPIGLQTVCINFGGLILQVGINRHLGTDYIAATSAASPLVGWLQQPIVLWGVVLRVFSGQNYGAGKIDRLRRGIRLSLLICLSYSVVAVALSYFLAYPVATLFSDRTEILPTAELYTWITTLALPLVAILNTFRDVLYGLGHGVIAVWGGLSETIVNTVCGLWLIESIGMYGALLAHPISWLLSCIVFTIAGLMVLRKAVRTHAQV